ncbi:lysis system i-spanin subunit Rz [Pseudomonas migulae]|uniref:Lysis protein n=1 Tax=Pseudomonas migulae TaxID=78543 RepID=A0ABY8MYW5_9PSED|nr:lysis system i-spanin subunit Rz [Pseudomonas migulae]WGK92573.1 lysis protein [Pseudomonas migulae]
MIPLSWRIGGALVLIAILMAGSGAMAWQWQANSYGKQLAEQTRLHSDDLSAISNAAADQVRADQEKRLALEQRLSVSDQTHHKELSDAQSKQARVRDRLATAELRLSVLLDATDSASGCSVPAGTEAVSVVHGEARARLDPAHAQRIIGITDAGDQGLIALAACQAYVRDIALGM